MEIELRTFANFRDAIGQKTVRREFDDSSVRVKEVLRPLQEEYPELELFDEDGTLQDFITVMKNGREVAYIEGLETELEDGDTLSLFPPVAGGCLE